MKQTFAPVVDQVLRNSPYSARALAVELQNDGYFVSSPTLSQWRSGTAIPYLTEDTLHRLLAVERRAGADPGVLVAALYRTWAKGEDTAWRWSRGSAPAGGPFALRAALEAEGVTNRCRSTIVTLSDEYAIGEERKPLHWVSRFRVCALMPDVDRRWVVFTVDDSSPIDLKPGDGCELGRQPLVTDSGYQVRAVELLHPKLDVGACHDLEFTLVNPEHPEIGGIPWPGWIRVIEDPGCRRLDMRIGFDTRQRPKTVWRGTWEVGPDGPPEPGNQEFVTSENGQFELSEPNPRPHAYGLRWRWYGDMDAVPLVGAGRESTR